MSESKKIISVVLLYMCSVAFSNPYSTRKCNDCIPLRACERGLKAIAATLEAETEESKATLTKTFCGAVSKSEPKVCCSEFPEIVDEIENHPNVALLPDKCGSIDGSRIIEGSVPKLFEFPWMSLISYMTPNGPDFRCGGSVISSRYILTAAHCVVKEDVLGVRIGEFDITSKKDCQGETRIQQCAPLYQDIGVANVTIHPNYKKVNDIPINDIALILLQDPIKLQKNAAPVCLPVAQSLRDRELSGRKMNIAGWGATQYDHYSNVLLKAKVSVVTDKACRDAYNIETNGSLCALGIHKEDSCKGDSGGPLMTEVDDEGVKIVQYGIISSGRKECGSNEPGIYTDVTKFMKWILDTIKV